MTYLLVRVADFRSFGFWPVGVLESPTTGEYITGYFVSTLLSADTKTTIGRVARNKLVEIRLWVRRLASSCVDRLVKYGTNRNSGFT